MFWDRSFHELSVENLFDTLRIEADRQRAAFFDGRRAKIAGGAKNRFFQFPLIIIAGFQIKIIRLFAAAGINFIDAAEQFQRFVLRDDALSGAFLNFDFNGILRE